MIYCFLSFFKIKTGLVLPKSTSEPLFKSMSNCSLNTGKNLLNMISVRNRFQSFFAIGVLDFRLGLEKKMKWSCPGLSKSFVSHVCICILKILDQVSLVLKSTVPMVVMPLVHILLNNALSRLCFYDLICKMQAGIMIVFSAN